MTVSDKLYVVRLPDNGGAITCTDEAKARESLANHPGSTFGWQPFPSPVKMPRVGRGEYEISFDGDCWVGTYLPLGISGWGLDHWDAYKGMLRAIRAHLEAQTETAIPV